MRSTTFSNLVFITITAGLAQGVLGGQEVAALGLEIAGHGQGVEGLGRAIGGQGPVVGGEADVAGHLF